MEKYSTNSPDPNTPIVDQVTLSPQVAALHTEALFGKLVKEINQMLTKGSGYEKVLDFTFESLGHLIPYDRMGIAVIEDHPESLTLRWVRSKGPAVHLPQNYSARITEGSLKNVLATGQPRIINDLPNYLRQHPHSVSSQLALQDGIQSSLTCPLSIGFNHIGIIFFSSFKINSYDHNHVDVFSKIADELALIVDYGRLQHFFSENREMVQSFRTVVHDLRAPLSILQGYLDLATSEDWFQQLEPESQEIFSILQKNTQYMFEILADLSHLHDCEHVVSEHAVLSFCQEMAQRGALLAKAKQILFEVSFENLPLSARFNYEKICRVLDNIFTNAVKFSPRNSKIKFSVFSENNKLIFSVSDRGPGIPAEEQAQLFYKIGKTSVGPTEGESSTGLGLVIARKLVEAHKGQISVVSHPGQGSTFSFRIPL